MPRKRYLFTPGPTPVPPEVLAVMAEPVLHHRGPDFKRAYERCLEMEATVHFPPENDRDIDDYYALFVFDPDGIRIEVFWWDRGAG